MKYVGEDVYWKSGFVQVWNIKIVKPGKYRVVAEMSFYSYFDWHNCPSPERISLTIKKKPVNGVNVQKLKD